ncbi:hypothetical protein EYF80_050818 [Liparis tanakae]|uniref:Uncharacterized protein n=1 Tax=Liparis tanakae TaxID=230148 RepID=A0A4Z2FDF2_9TELE|nr:hypothetical protein EYF80_050818 [Liparis tanakae]
MAGHRVSLGPRRQYDMRPLPSPVQRIGNVSQCFQRSRGRSDHNYTMSRAGRVILFHGTLM